jgi:predicted Ser/Thr protein kinase
MNISSQEADKDSSEIKSVCSRLVGSEVTYIQRIGGGRNSKVYKLTCENDSQYAAKLYFRHKSDQRNRLVTEFSSLQFLWENGVSQIPQPLVADKDFGCALYEYIEGSNILPEEVTSNEISQAVNFLIKLAELKTRENSHLLPLASEAFF